LARINYLNARLRDRNSSKNNETSKMKIIIIAGGLGTRLSEETEDKPKPMVIIRDKPILWHIMNIYAIQGFNEFIVSTGYKSEIIEDWVSSDNHVDLMGQKLKIKVINTGIDTQTGGRILEVLKQFPNEQFMATYGDGLANINVRKLINFHKVHTKLATITSVRPPARFGYLKMEENKVVEFGEKNQSDAGWINGGFFVLEPSIIEFIKHKNEPLESGALTRLTEIGQLMAFRHEGFWQPMDTLREKRELEKYANLPKPPWLNLGR
jgi:glucose-1-phosphate cytidylyltransferase